MKRAFEFTGVFEAGLKLQEDLGIIQEIDNATHTSGVELRENLEKVRNAVKNAVKEKNSVHYKYWS